MGILDSKVAIAIDDFLDLLLPAAGVVCAAALAIGSVASVYEQTRRLFVFVQTTAVISVVSVADPELTEAPPMPPSTTDSGRFGKLVYALRKAEAEEALLPLRRYLLAVKEPTNESITYDSRRTVFKDGEQVNIAYEPSDPSSTLTFVREESFAKSTVGNILADLLILGVGMAGLLLAARIFVRRRKRNLDRRRLGRRPAR
jgi:hypothetical protein